MQTVWTTRRTLEGSIGRRSDSIEINVLLKNAPTGPRQNIGAIGAIYFRQSPFVKPNWVKKCILELCSLFAKILGRFDREHWIKMHIRSMFCYPLSHFVHLFAEIFPSGEHAECQVVSCSSQVKPAFSLNGHCCNWFPSANAPKFLRLEEARCPTTDLHYSLWS